VDNTFATPVLQRPGLLGADIVVHSATKYLAGHSDVVLGIVAMDSEETAEKLRFIQTAAGAVPGPMDCWLAHRGLKTLKLRMEAHTRGASAVASALLELPGVKKVYYPGHPGHPGHTVASRQMESFGGMVAAELEGGRKAAEAFLESLEIFSLADSLGGVESLACHPSSMTHASMPEEAREAIGITEGLVRLSVGIEDPEDLVEDVRRALHKASGKD
jgi:cystathionine beta-lyase/cystathionine gamma-synthase